MTENFEYPDSSPENPESCDIAQEIEQLVASWEISEDMWRYLSSLAEKNPNACTALRNDIKGLKSDLWIA